MCAESDLGVEYCFIGAVLSVRELWENRVVKNRCRYRILGVVLEATEKEKDH